MLWRLDSGLPKETGAGVIDVVIDLQDSFKVAIEPTDEGFGVGIKIETTHEDEGPETIDLLMNHVFARRLSLALYRASIEAEFQENQS